MNEVHPSERELLHELLTQGVVNGLDEVKRVTLVKPCGSGKTELVISLMNTIRRKKWQRVLVVLSGLEALNDFHRRFTTHSTSAMMGSGTMVHSVVGIKKGSSRKSTANEGTSSASAVMTGMTERLKAIEIETFEPDEEDSSTSTNRLVVLTIYTNMRHVQAANITWDAVILDEAHHALAKTSAPGKPLNCRPLPTSRIPLFDWDEDSEFYNKGGIQADERVMLTATLPEEHLSNPIFGRVIVMDHELAKETGCILGVQLVFVQADTEAAMLQSILSRDDILQYPSCFVFAKTKSLARSLCALAQETASPLKYVLSGERFYEYLEDTPSEDKEEAMMNIKNAWIFTCRCATDAVDCPGVSVILTNPINSEVLLKQIIGRAQRVVEGRQNGTAFLRVPVGVDSLETLRACEDPSYKTVLKLIDEGLVVVE